MRSALTVAGSDSSAGAGVAADLKTFDAHGVWGVVAVTAVTAQGPAGVGRIQVVDPAVVRAQIGAVRFDAAKTGMLGTAAVVGAVADALAAAAVPLVGAPVLVSTSGAPLLDEDGLIILRDELLPLATIVTPNLAEASRLLDRPVSGRDDMAPAAAALVAMGCRAALVTGGHLPGDRVVDCLVVGEEEPVWFEGPRLPGAHTHGTGCVLSAAITARLAGGEPIAAACGEAVTFVRGAIAHGVGGSVNPSWRR